MNFKKFLDSVSKIKNNPLPGYGSQIKMAPSFREELIKRHKAEMKYAKKAAVMALFYPDNNDRTSLVLILRKTYKGVHSAQIGFPGGKLEPHDDNLEAAALRETFEEIGVPQHKIQVIKTLTEVYIPPSNYFVQPFLGVSKELPLFVKQDEEVEDILEVTLNEFLDERNVKKKIVPTAYNINVKVPAMLLKQHIVWGATAMMLSEIKDLLKQSL